MDKYVCTECYEVSASDELACRCGNTSFTLSSGGMGTVVTELTQKGMTVLLCNDGSDGQNKIELMLKHSKKSKELCDTIYYSLLGEFDIANTAIIEVTKRTHHHKNTVTLTCAYLDKKEFDESRGKVLLAIRKTVNYFFGV